MARVHKTKKGYKFILRTPKEKAKRYRRQLNNGKVSETRKKLTKSDKAYRYGYLDSRKDMAKAFNSSKKKR